MKSIKFVLYIFLWMLGVNSCDNNKQIEDLSHRKYVRINQASLTLSAGETYRIIASFDSEETAAMKFNWSVDDTSVATIVSNADNTGTITGISEGQTVIQVESENGQLKYFSTLYVQKDRITKVLVIGNEFSEDAVQTYLHELASAGGNNMVIGNMYIENGSLEDHWENASDNKSVYEFRKIAANGTFSRDENYAISAAVKSENWEYIFFQEAGNLAGVTEGYQLYLPKLIEYVKGFTTNPNVKLGLHQTWSFDSNKTEMYEAIVEATSKAAQITGIDVVVPTGTAIQNARTTYLRSRFIMDDYRLTGTVGKFAAACTWYEVLFGNVGGNSFRPQDMLDYDYALIKTAAGEAVSEPFKVTVLEDYLYPEQHNDFVLEQPIFIDFGPVVAGGYFNHYGDPRDPKVTDLKDMNGTNTHFEIGVDYGFTGIIDRDLPNELGFPWTVSNDMFFADGIDVTRSSLILSNLNTTRKYTFIFYALINDPDYTETEYQVIGDNQGVAYLAMRDNRSDLAVVSDIIPNGDGSIVINLQAGPRNIQWAQFYAIGTMIIIPEGYPIPF